MHTRLLVCIIMNDTLRNILSFLVGFLTACATFIYINIATAQEIVINDTPLSDVTILDTADTSFNVDLTVSDEISSGYIEPLKPAPDLSQSVLALKDTNILNDEKLLKDSQEIVFFEKKEYLQVKDMINVYQSPDGWGYQTVEKLQDKIIYTGYGINSKDYTYTVDISAVTSIASSTKPRI